MTPLTASPVPDPAIATHTDGRRHFRIRLMAAAGLILFSVGAAFAGAAVGAQSEAATYQAATACAAGARVAGPNCFAREPAAVRSVSITHGRSSDNAVVDLAFGGRNRHIYLTPVDRVEGELRAGASVIAHEYRGQIAAVEVGSYVIGTGQSNPIVQARLLAFAALLLTGLGLVVLARLVPGIRMPAPASPSASPDGIPPADCPLTLPLVLRPEARSARGHVIGIGTIAIFSLGAVAGLRDWAPLGFAVLASGLLAYVIARWLYLHNADIFVDELHVGKRDLLGRATILDRSAIQKVVLTMQESTTRYGTTQIRRLFLVGQDGRSWLRLNGAYWSPASVAMLAKALRVPIEGSWDHPADLASVRRSIPGSFTWLEAHSTVAGVVISLLILVAIVVTVLIATGIQGSAA